MEEDRRTDAESADMQAEEAEMQRLQQEIRNMPVADHVLYMMHSLSGLAAGRLGLGGEAQPRKDLNQARLAIDAFRALLEVIEHAVPAGAAAHRGMLAQLQLAYVAALDDRPTRDDATQAAPAGEHAPAGEEPGDQEASEDPAS